MVPDLNQSQTSETVFLLGHRAQRGTEKPDILGSRDSRESHASSSAMQE